MNIISAQYVNDLNGVTTTIKLTLDSGEVWSVPIIANNRHYAEILLQVEAGELTIADAD